MCVGVQMCASITGFPLFFFPCQSSPSIKVSHSGSARVCVRVDFHSTVCLSPDIMSPFTDVPTTSCLSSHIWTHSQTNNPKCNILLIDPCPPSPSRLKIINIENVRRWGLESWIEKVENVEVLERGWEKKIACAPNPKPWKILQQTFSGSNWMCFTRGKLLIPLCCKGVLLNFARVWFAFCFP